MLRVIGIDPGSRITGWGVVCEEKNTFSLVRSGIIRTDPKEDFPKRLAAIYCGLARILDDVQPHEASIEQVFVSKNIQSALKLGQARGAAIAACAAKNIPVKDYEPTLVKKAIVGVGHAEKAQVAYMVKTLLRIPNAKWALDTSDALGVALCHLMMRGSRLIM